MVLAALGVWTLFLYAVSAFTLSQQEFEDSRTFSWSCTNSVFGVWVWFLQVNLLS
jgi:hypothetical protein